MVVGDRLRDVVGSERFRDEGCLGAGGAASVGQDGVVVPVNGSLEVVPASIE